MRNQFKSLVLLLVAGCWLFIGVSTARAQTLLSPFGGFVSMETECTCSGNTWIWFTPLYLGGAEVLTGPMVYSPYFTTLYAYYEIGVPGTWELGDYVSDAGSCQMEYVYGCYELPAVGIMNKVGTNYSL